MTMILLRTLPILSIKINRPILLMLFIVFIFCNGCLNKSNSSNEIKYYGKINWTFINSSKSIHFGIKDGDLKKILKSNILSGCSGDDCGYEDTLHKEYLKIDSYPFLKDSVKASWRFFFYNDQLVKIKLIFSNCNADSIALRKFLTYRGLEFLHNCKIKDTKYYFSSERKSLTFVKNIANLTKGGKTFKYTIECDSLHWSLSNKY